MQKPSTNRSRKKSQIDHLSSQVDKQRKKTSTKIKRKQELNSWICGKVFLEMAKNTTYSHHGPLEGAKQKHPAAWSSGIMPPPRLVSIDSSSLTTSSISGRFSGFASQHLFMMLARELGQHRGMSGRRFWQKIRRVRGRFASGDNRFDLLRSYLSYDSRWYICEAKIWIWQITAIYFPEANTEAVHIAFPVIRLPIEHLCRW